MKTRIISSLVLLLVGFLMVPQIIIFLGYFKEYQIAAPSIFMKEITFWENITTVFEEKKLRNVWYYFQIGILILIFLVFWQDKFFKKNKKLTDFGTPETSGHGEYGTSRWRTAKEIDESTTVWKMKKDDHARLIPPQVSKNPYSKNKYELAEKKTIGGIILGYDIKKNKVYLDVEDTNALIIGTSRSGKTRTFLFPTIWELAKSKESMIITDPKGEIHKLTNMYLKEEGYNIVLLDFRDPRRGNHWNVLKPVLVALSQGDEAKANEAAEDIAHSIVYQVPRKGDPVWPNGSKSVIMATILAVATSDANDDEKNMTNVYQNIVELGVPVLEEMENGKIQERIPLNDYFKNLPPGHIAKSAYGVAMLSPEKMRGSFFSDAASCLRLFSDPGLSYMTKIQDHDLKDVGRVPTAVFLCIPDEKTTKHIFASLYVNQTYEALVELANEHGGRIPNRVNNLLDEFGNMPTIPDFDTKVTVSLGRGIRWILIVQDLQQLKKRYEDNALTITGNCHTWIYLLTTDFKTAEEISKRTGTYTIETESKSSSIQDKGSSKSMSEGLARRTLLTADEILRWPVENALVFQARHFPAHLPLPDISKYEIAHKEMQEYMEPYTKMIVPSTVYLLRKGGLFEKFDKENEKEQPKAFNL